MPLYELSGYVENEKQYLNVANKMLDHLTRNYRSFIGGNKGFILLHSTGSKPAKSDRRASYLCRLLFPGSVAKKEQAEVNS